MPRTVVDAADVDAVTDAVLTASRLLVAVSARSIAATGDAITLPQFRLLVVLHSRGPVKHGVLAEQLEVAPSTASRMVDRLVSAGLIERRHSAASRREVVLELTRAGARVVRQVTSRRRTEIAKIVERMPLEARNGLVEVLTAFTEAGGEPPAGADPDDAWT